jgi:hypothetical protein
MKKLVQALSIYLLARTISGIILNAKESNILLRKVYLIWYSATTLFDIKGEGEKEGNEVL